MFHTSISHQYKACGYATVQRVLCAWFTSINQKLQVVLGLIKLHVTLPLQRWTDGALGSQSFERAAVCTQARPHKCLPGVRPRVHRYRITDGLQHRITLGLAECSSASVTEVLFCQMYRCMETEYGKNLKWLE